MSRYVDPQNEVRVFLLARDLGFIVLFFIVSLMAGCPYYSVWQQGLAGKAALERATQDRQIAIQEAQAKKESATMLADAEIARARGVAEANKIIGDSLKGNEAYLRYLWIDGLKTDNTQVVYVPTEAGIPILEAGRMGTVAKPAAQ